MNNKYSAYYGSIFNYELPVFKAIINTMKEHNYILSYEDAGFGMWFVQIKFRNDVEDATFNCAKTALIKTFKLNEGELPE